MAATLLACAAASGCSGCRHGAPTGGRPAAESPSLPESHPTPPTAPASDEKVLTIIATSEIRGTPEPCGCQSDPLGDVARVATLLTDAKKRGGAILVDAGGLLYKEDATSPERMSQAHLKADFLEKTWRDLGAEVGLGDEDLSLGLDAADVHSPTGRTGVPLSDRLCSNLAGPPRTKAPHITEVAGIKVGVFAVIAPGRAVIPHEHALPPEADVKATDPTEAAKQAVIALQQKGAQVIVALAHLPRPEARKLAREVPGLSIVVAGDECGDDGGEPEQVGETIVVQPADQAQKAARIELHLVGGKVSTKLFAGSEERQRNLDRLNKKLDQLGIELSRLAADPAADAGFLATKRAEDTRLRGERDRLKAASPTPPAEAYAVAQLVPIRRKIARDEKVAAAMKELDKRVGETNRAEAEKVPPPPAGKREAHYAGIDECESCHKKAVAFWKDTVHAKAWNELVVVNKQWSYDCISCHVTGYGRKGGTSMAHVDNLTDVQCEVCHGPGSLHADVPKKAHLRNPVEADCKDCHTKEHSDTFQYEPYLRDILGPGHGEKRRAELGPGPTGHDLRHGAIERAKEK